LGNEVDQYIISSKTVDFDAKILNVVIFFSDLVNFFVNLVIFSEKPVAALIIQARAVAQVQWCHS